MLNKKLSKQKFDLKIKNKLVNRGWSASWADMKSAELSEVTEAALEILREYSAASIVSFVKQKKAKKLCVHCKKAAAMKDDCVCYDCCDQLKQLIEQH